MCSCANKAPFTLHPRVARVVEILVARTTAFKLQIANGKLFFVVAVILSNGAHSALRGFMLVQVALRAVPNAALGATVDAHHQPELRIRRVAAACVRPEAFFAAWRQGGCSQLLRQPHKG